MLHGAIWPIVVKVTYAFSSTDIMYDLCEEIKWDDMLCMSKPQSIEI